MYILQGCQWEVIKKPELHFVVSLCVCIGDVQYPKGAMTEAQKRLRERNMSLYIASEIIPSDLDQSQESINAKKQISAVWQKIGIPHSRSAFCYLHNYFTSLAQPSTGVLCQI